MDQPAARLKLGFWLRTTPSTFPFIRYNKTVLPQQGTLSNNYTEKLMMNIKTLFVGLSLAASAIGAWAEPVCSVGDKAQVEWKGSMYPATVLKVNEDQTRCFIHYEGYASSWDEWVGKDRIQISSSAAASGGGFKVGDAVEVNWKGAWYKASVMAVKGGKTKIHYDGYDNSWDEWVGLSRIRAVQ